MSRLYRPPIPAYVKCRVLLRQLEMGNANAILDGWRASRVLTGAVESLKAMLAERLGCSRSALRLDHDPALATRDRTGVGKQTVYTPDANDPNHLVYRTAHDHHIKTNVRGEHGQHPDRVLIKRAKRHIDTSDIPEANEAWFKRAKLKWPKRKIANRKRPWAKRPFRSQKATRTVRRRRWRSARRVRHQLRHHESART